MGRFIQVLLLVIVVLGVGFYVYQRNIAPVPITAADLEKGGNFSSDERATLTSACSARFKKDTDKVCGCIANKVTTEFSRFDRLVITASLQEKLSDIVSLTKGLVQSGIPADQVKNAEDGSRTRVKDMLKTCSAE